MVNWCMQADKGNFNYYMKEFSISWDTSAPEFCFALLFVRGLLCASGLKYFQDWKVPLTAADLKREDNIRIQEDFTCSDEVTNEPWRQILWNKIGQMKILLSHFSIIIALQPALQAQSAQMAKQRCQLRALPLSYGKHSFSHSSFDPAATLLL